LLINKLNIDIEFWEPETTSTSIAGLRFFENLTSFDYFNHVLSSYYDLIQWIV